MKRSSVSLVLLLSLALSAPLFPVHADTAEEIQAKIEEQQTKIILLEKEIAEYEATLVELGKSKSSLENEVKRLDTSRKKLNADISITQDKIETANLEIERLGGEIGSRETKISLGKRGIQESMRSLLQQGDITLIEHLFTASGMESYWEDKDALQFLEHRIRSEAVNLAIEKTALSHEKSDVEVQRSTLASLNTQLKGQKVVLDQNRAEQATLLSQTKKSEANYQAILKEKQEARLLFEQQLSDYESQLKYTLDPTALPPVGTGVLSLPIDSTFMSRCKSREKTYGNPYCITQFFGNTKFAQSGAYNGAGHNGIDFGTPEGTKIVAANSGTVVATGNTDLQKGCYSYGKWLLVKHNNGLTTLYAHLSYIAVSEGQSVPVGGMLGYSGKTGYATGPHLHFTVFASDGVQIVRMGDIKAKTNCANVMVPIAPTSAYLNPMSYL